MRITHVITRLIVGGAQENTVATVLGLRLTQSLTVDLISGPTTGPEGSIENSFDDHPNCLRLIPTLIRPVSPLADLKALSTLTDIFREERPDIVHTHSGKAGILGRLAAHRAKIPIIIHTIHGPSFGTWQGTMGNLVYRAAEKSVASMTTHFISVANAMTEQYLKAGISTPDKYTRVFSGFPLEQFLRAENSKSLRAKYGIAPDELVIGKLARIIPLKGHDDLFAAAPEIIRAFPKTKFLLVGGGPLEDHFRNLARQSGLEKHFVFTGLIPPAQIPGIVGIMDILVHLSLREGLPRALPQALAARKPVVAFDCDGAGEVCIEGQTGFLVKARDITGFAAAVKKLAESKALRQQFGENGRHLVEANFSTEKMVSDIYALYRRLSEQRAHERGRP
jgi:glycosyltransferase involved in cell wall biosynthesis